MRHIRCGLLLGVHLGGPADVALVGDYVIVRLMSLENGVLAAIGQREEDASLVRYEFLNGAQHALPPRRIR